MLLFATNHINLYFHITHLLPYLFTFKCRNSRFWARDSPRQILTSQELFELWKGLRNTTHLVHVQYIHMDIMTYHWAPNTFRELYVLCCSVVAHSGSKPTSYPLNWATSDTTPKRGQVCQQLIHHAQYQLISKHKQSISDIRDSWIGGAHQRKQTYASRANCQPPCSALSPTRLAWFSLVPRFLQLFYFRSTTLLESSAMTLWGWL